MGCRIGMLLKYTFDRVVAFTGLLVLSPLIAAIALLIRIKMPDGPVIYTQKRVGRGGRLFSFHKFRTMTVSSDGSTVSMAEPGRITGLGGVLRRYKLDELPNLWDVLTGKMSIVGPRPDVEGYADRLQGEDREILQLLPGITGPATLKYRDEDRMVAEYAARCKAAGDERPLRAIAEEYNDSVYPDKVRLNLYYLHHYSFVTDIRIIFCTLFGCRMKYDGEVI